MRDKRLMWVWLYKVLEPCNAKFLELLRKYDYIDEIYERRQSSDLGLILNPSEYKRARTVSLEECKRVLDECDAKGITVLNYSDEEYPEKLRQTRVPPMVLFCTGDISVLGENSVAGVGARESTQYGRDAVKLICEPLVRAGLVLVSGLALGIDGEVHKAALGGNGKTVAVLGNAIDYTYPKGHEGLRAEIEKNGCVVSEYPPHTAAMRYMFPQRNRIISGLSRAVVIFEAAKKSGTMITASWALGDGRDIFAVPGSVLSTQSEGTNYLIKNGAIPALTALDIFEELGIEGVSLKPNEKLTKKPMPKLTAQGKRICDSLLDGELTVDDILVKTEMLPHELFSTLTELEVDGVIEASAGSRYRLK